MYSFCENHKNSLLAGLFVKENCFPLIKLEFIPLKLTCRRAQQAGKGSPAVPGNSSNAPINCTWTRKKWHFSQRPHGLSLRAQAIVLFFFFYSCSSWSCEIPIAFQLSFSEKKEGGGFYLELWMRLKKGTPRAQAREGR